MDPDYAKALGVDIDELLLSQPDTGEQALEVTDMLVKSGSLDVIVVDSVAALVPRAELEGRYGRFSRGLTGQINVSSIKKNYWKHPEIKYLGNFYQPNKDEDWRDVWQSRNNNRW